MNKNVAILGATDDPSKYAYKALKSLQEHGYTPIPINPNKDSIEGVKCFDTLAEVPEQIDTITLYVRPSISSQLADDILAAKPRRIIMNPGTENPDLAAKCEENGIEVVEGCTLVMLGTGQF